MAPILRPMRQDRYDYLRHAGFNHGESMEYSRQYSMTQLRTLPYLQTMIRWRRLYVSKLRHLGYSDSQIRSQVVYLYYKNGWMTTENTMDAWAMLKKFRNDSIESGDYIPPVKPKQRGISKGDVEAQRLRAKARQKTGGSHRRKLSVNVSETLERIKGYNRDIAAETDEHKRNGLIQARNSLWKRISKDQ